MSKQTTRRPARIAGLGLLGVLALAPAAYGEDAVTTPQGPTAQSDTPTQPVGRPPAEKEDARPPQIETLISSTGVLTPKGKFILEPSFQYAYSSVYRIGLEGYTVLPAILIGAIQIEDTSRNTYIAALTGRYGLTDRLEVEARVPYVWRTDSSLTRNVQNGGTSEPILVDADGSDIGDVEVAAHYQLNRGGQAGFYVGNLRVKTITGKNPFEVPRDPATNLLTELPTGTGFWSVQPSLTAIFPSDPAVFYGNLSYSWNIERDVGYGYGKIDPGDAVGFGFGMGLSLNEKASFSLGYDHSIIGKPKQNGMTVPNTRMLQVGSVLFGYSYRLTPKTGFNLNFGVGATQDAPDVQLTLRLPITF
ncbi:MAG: transporter [Pseudomonadota bacterium]